MHILLFCVPFSFSLAASIPDELPGMHLLKLIERIDEPTPATFNSFSGCGYESNFPRVSTRELNRRAGLMSGITIPKIVAPIERLHPSWRQQLRAFGVVIATKDS